MESGAAGANSVKRVANMQIGASGTRLEVQSADSKSDRVWNWGAGGVVFKGTDEDEEEEDGGQDGSCPAKTLWRAWNKKSAGGPGYDGM